MPRKKIAIMLPKLSLYGGVEGFAWRLAEALARDHDVHFICARQETASPAGVRVIRVGRPFFGKFFKILWFALAAEWVRRRQDYDLTIGLGNTIIQDILRVSGGPTRIFWKHSIKAYPRGYARTWKMIRRKISPANNLVLAIEKLQMRFSGRIIANSHMVREWTLAAFPHLKHGNVDIIYNRPDLSKFSSCSSSEKTRARKKLGIGGNKKVIATAGTNFMLKGIRPLIATMAHLPDDTLLVVAGGRHCGKYRRLAEKLGLADRVHFLGRVDDMPTVYHASDLFILLSFYDACSNAVLEALASGLPVISTTTNGSSFFVPENHIVAPDIAPRDLAKIIQNKLGQQPHPFSFPADVPSGIAPYVHLVEDTLENMARGNHHLTSP